MPQISTVYGTPKLAEMLIKRKEIMRGSVMRVDQAIDGIAQFPKRGRTNITTRIEIDVSDGDSCGCVSTQKKCC